MAYYAAVAGVAATVGLVVGVAATVGLVVGGMFAGCLSWRVGFFKQTAGEQVHSIGPAPSAAGDALCSWRNPGPRVDAA